MLLLLVITAGLYIFIGEASEAKMLGTFVLVVIGITFFQERKTERALLALNGIASPRALVMRDGKQIRIAGREVVRDDLLILNEGDRVPADACLLSAQNLQINESLLTGEALPVDKFGGKEGEPIDRVNMVYSGTLVSQGHGLARVTAVGITTEMGQIGKSLQSIQPGPSRLQSETRRIVKIFFLFGVAVCVLVSVAYSLIQHSWLKGVEAGLALGMSVLPEEFPVILTIFLALGAWRMASRRVLARRPAAIESLGAATVLCVDKTGTLTMNHLSVAGIIRQGNYYPADGFALEKVPETRELIRAAVLGCRPTKPDAIEEAIESFGARLDEGMPEDKTMLKEYPLTPDRLLRIQVWEMNEARGKIAAAMGAPEAVATACRVSQKEAAEIQKEIEVYSQKGMRLIGIAIGNIEDSVQVPEQPSDISLRWCGLIALQDPVRPGVAKAIQVCYQAGLKVIMITGDHPKTAMAVADKIGLVHNGDYVTGPEFDSLTEKELAKKVRTCSLYARVMPRHKLRLVELLRQQKEVVVMTGDGVNDAPALKAAHIGVAMGQRGTDVARESASLVLLDDDFSSIVAGVRLGRRTFDNIRKAFAYTAAVHIPIALISLAPLLFGWPLILLPAHIALMEIIIDPSCSVVFEAEPEEKDIMNRPPRRLTEPIITAPVFWLSLLQGVSVSILPLIVYYFAFVRHGYDSDGARYLAFATLLAANISLILVNRNWTKGAFSTLRQASWVLWVVMAGVALLIALPLSIPYLANLLSFSLVDVHDVVVAAGLGVAIIVWLEIIKNFLFRPHRVMEP
jgi:Ca2+-transporting ATPase